MNLRRLTISDCRRLKEECNFSDDEDEVFALLVKNKSRVQIADAVGMSVASVDRRIRKIKEKVKRVSRGG